MGFKEDCQTVELILREEEETRDIRNEDRGVR
jgi:hypothetical protein